MLKVAPPGFVVAMVASVLWIPWSFLMGALELSRGAVFGAAHYALSNGGMIVIALALGNLASRTRGWQRFALRVSTVAWTLDVVLLIGSSFLVYIVEIDIHRLQSWARAIEWADASLKLIAWLALAVAGLRANRATAITLFAMVLVADQLPPIRDWLYKLLDNWFAIALIVVMMPLRNLFAILLSGAIARRGYDPRHDHRSAARSMRVVATAIAAFTAVQIGIAIGGALAGDEVETTFGFAIATAIPSLLLAIALWRLAQTELPALPKFRVHVAALAAMYTTAMLVQLITHSYRGRRAFLFDGASQLTWWELAPAMVSLALVVSCLGRYAKRRPAVKAATMLGGGLFTAAVAGWAIFHDRPLAAPLCLAVGCAALVPAVLRAGKELAADRVETTADVFA